MVQGRWPVALGDAEQCPALSAPTPLSGRLVLESKVLATFRALELNHIQPLSPTCLRIVPRRVTRLKRKPPILPLLVLTEAAFRHAATPIRPLPHSERIRRSGWRPSLGRESWSCPWMLRTCGAPAKAQKRPWAGSMWPGLGPSAFTRTCSTGGILAGIHEGVALKAGRPSNRRFANSWLAEFRLLNAGKTVDGSRPKS